MRGRVYDRGNKNSPNYHPNYWIAYNVDGKEYRESCGTDDPKKAERMLTDRTKLAACHDLLGTKFITRKDRKRTVPDLLDALHIHFKITGKLSDAGPHGCQLRSQIRKAKTDLGEEYRIPIRALALTSERIAKYIDSQLERGYRPATINRTLQILGQAFRLGKLPSPSIPHLSEKGNERRGFFEDADILAVLENLRVTDANLADFCEWAWLTGQRKKEIASLRWADLEGDTLRLTANNAKNRTARDIPITGDRLIALIERRRLARKVKQTDGTVKLTDLIFHRAGRPVQDFRDSWATACKLAGVHGRIFHDLRRTAARNLLLAGVRREVAKQITGHKTDSMFNRYTFPTAADLRNAMEAVQARPMQPARMANLERVQ